MLTLLVLFVDHILVLAGGSSKGAAVAALLALPPAWLLDFRVIRRRRANACVALHIAVGLYLLWGLLPWPEASMGEPQLRVEKSRRQLIHQGKCYPIALGHSWRGNKSAMGDGRTPEGHFRICSKESCGPFGPWLGLDYPQRNLAIRARFEGRLSWLELTRWRWFWRPDPPQSTCLGGQVGLHGGGTRRDWTLGCIALETADAKLLFEKVPLGAVVEIVP